MNKETIQNAILALALGLGGWALYTTSEHGERIARMEARTDSTEKALQEIGKSIDKRLDHLEAKIDALMRAHP